MKKLILSIMFSLFVSVAFADQYAVIFIGSTVDGEDLTQALENIREVGGDASIIAVANMPIWCEKADTNATGYVCSIRTDGLGVKGWKDMPLAQVETRITKDVKPPSKQKITVNSMEDFRVEYEPKETELPE